MDEDDLIPKELSDELAAHKELLVTHLDAKALCKKLKFRQGCTERAKAFASLVSLNGSDSEDNSRLSKNQQELSRRRHNAVKRERRRFKQLKKSKEHLDEVLSTCLAEWRRPLLRQKCSMEIEATEMKSHTFHMMDMFCLATEELSRTDRMLTGALMLLKDCHLLLYSYDSNPERHREYQVHIVLLTYLV